MAYLIQPGGQNSTVVMILDDQTQYNEKGRKHNKAQKVFDFSNSI